VRLTFSPSVPKLESNAQMAGLIVRPVNARLFALDVTFPGNWIVNRKSVTDAGLDIGCRGSFGEYLKDDAYLRIERAGDSWRCAYSEKGDNWIWIAPKVENSGILSDGVEIVLFAYSTSKSPIAVQFTDWAVYDR
jgi:hypothetical protein